MLAREHKANVVLVARRMDELEALARELRAQHQIEVRSITANLSREDEADHLFHAATSGLHLHAAVLNARVTHFGHHDELSWDAFKQMLALNIVSFVGKVAAQYRKSLLDSGAAAHSPAAPPTQQP